MDRVLFVVADFPVHANTLARVPLGGGLIDVDEVHPSRFHPREG